MAGLLARMERATSSIIKHTYLVIIELATGAANYITEAEEEESEGGREGEIYGPHKGVVSTG